jgi:hypothetical protein
VHINRGYGGQCAPRQAILLVLSTALRYFEVDILDGFQKCNYPDHSATSTASGDQVNTNERILCCLYNGHSLFCFADFFRP